VPPEGAPLSGGGAMQIVEGGDRGRDVVVRPGEVPPRLYRQVGDMALDGGIGDVDQGSRMSRVGC
jgi:hypothetical protein